MTYFHRIANIAIACDSIGIPYTVKPLYEGYIITLPKGADIAAHNGTYGAASGKVESYCCPWDGDDVTVLTVEEAIERLTEWRAYFLS